MPRSSESVGALAGALAKAQAKLVNPEKSLTASIRLDRRGERPLPDTGRELSYIAGW